MAVLSNSFLLDVGILLLALLGTLYFYFSRNYRKWEKKGVPFVKPSPFVGNFKEVVFGKKSIGEAFHTIYNGCKDKPMMGFYAFDQPMLLVRDLEVVKTVLVKDFNYFLNRNFSSSEDSDPLVGKGLFAINGDRWRHLRMKLTPTFTSGKMKRMFTFIDECGKELVKYMNKYSESGRMEVKDTMARFTTDVIASCVFGIQGKALQEPDSEFRYYLRRIFDFTFLRGINTAIGFTAPALFSALKLKVVDEEVNQYMRNTIWGTVKHRKENGIVRQDFLDLLIQLKEKGSVDNEESNGHSAPNGLKFKFEGDDFVAQAFNFLAAGFETSSTTMSFTLYELALQPDIQTRLRDEIHSVLEKHGGQVTYEGIAEMQYLDMVVSETLRMYPVLPFLDRKVQQTYKLPGTDTQLDKDDVVIISVLGIQRDPKYYPNPHIFDPERFTEKNKQLRPNFAYLPFGEGPRNCIGMRIGLLQAKVGLVHLLSRFEVRPCEDTPIPMTFEKTNFLMSPRGSLPLSVRRIEQNT